MKMKIGLIIIIKKLNQPVNYPLTTIFGWGYDMDRRGADRAATLAYSGQ